MNFNARVISSEKKKAQLVESTYTNSITTRIIYPENTAFKENGIDFKMMVKCLKRGVKARRPTWKEGELLWKADAILVHNTPYWEDEEVNQSIGGYAYVAEEEDINANDWIICKEEA